MKKMISEYKKNDPVKDLNEFITKGNEPVFRMANYFVVFLISAGMVIFNGLQTMYAIHILYNALYSAVMVVCYLHPYMFFRAGSYDVVKKQYCIYSVLKGVPADRQGFRMNAVKHTVFFLTVLTAAGLLFRAVMCSAAALEIRAMDMILSVVVMFAVPLAEGVIYLIFLEKTA